MQATIDCKVRNTHIRKDQLQAGELTPPKQHYVLAISNLQTNLLLPSYTQAGEMKHQPNTHNTIMNAICPNGKYAFVYKWTNTWNLGWTSADRSTRLLSCLQYPDPFKSSTNDFRLQTESLLWSNWSNNITFKPSRSKRLYISSKSLPARLLA